MEVKKRILRGDEPTPLGSFLVSADDRAALKAAVKDVKLPKTQIEYMVQRIRAIQTEHRGKIPLDRSANGEACYVIGRTTEVDPDNQAKDMGPCTDRTFQPKGCLTFEIRLGRRSSLLQITRGCLEEDKIVALSPTDPDDVRYARPAGQRSKAHIHRVVLSQMADIVHKHPYLIWYLIYLPSLGARHHLQIFAPPKYDLLLKPSQRPFA